MAASVPNGLKPAGPTGGLPKAQDGWTEPDTICGMSGVVKVPDSGFLGQTAGPEGWEMLVGGSRGELEGREFWGTMTMT